MKKHYLVIWTKAYSPIYKSPISIIVNESNNANEIYQRIKEEIAENHMIKEYEVDIEGIYKL